MQDRLVQGEFVSSQRRPRRLNPLGAVLGIFCLTMLQQLLVPTSKRGCRSGIAAWQRQHYASSWPFPGAAAATVNVPQSRLVLQGRRRRPGVLCLASQVDSPTALLAQRSFHSTSASFHNSTRNETQTSTIHASDNDQDDNLSTNSPRKNPLLLNSSTTSLSSTASTAAPSISSSSSSSSSRISRSFRQGVGGLFSAAGFVSSSVASMVSNPRRFLDQTQQPLQAFWKFLKTSGIDMEVDQAIWKNRQLLLHLAVLARVQRILRQKTSSAPQQLYQDDPLLEQARRYMRYATAVYGKAMIRAVTVDARGRFDQVAQSVGQELLEAISQHIGVPSEDLVMVQVDSEYAPATSDEQQQEEHDHPILRHLVAVDHTHKEIVLGLRGTFSLQEIVVDLASFSRDFCGGQAHEGMATMAEQVWQVAGPTILANLQQHADYRLVITGHSLGAGTASLLTLLLKQQQRQQQLRQVQSTVPLLPASTELVCFAYASPPVFTPLEVVPQACQVITNVIHDTDVVPFLSVYSVRRLLANLKAIQQEMKDLAWSEKLAIAMEKQPPPDALLQAVELSSQPGAVIPKRGAPRLEVPAARTIWLRPHDKKNNNNDKSYHRQYKYEANLFQQRVPSSATIRIHSNMLLDHFPPRYEYALDRVWEGTNGGGEPDMENSCTSSE